MDLLIFFKSSEEGLNEKGTVVQCCSSGLLLFFDSCPISYLITSTPYSSIVYSESAASTLKEIRVETLVARFCHYLRCLSAMSAIMVVKFLKTKKS